MSREYAVSEERFKTAYLILWATWGFALLWSKLTLRHFEAIAGRFFWIAFGSDSNLNQFFEYLSQAIEEKMDNSYLETTRSFCFIIEAHVAHKVKQILYLILNEKSFPTQRTLQTLRYLIITYFDWYSTPSSKHTYKIKTDIKKWIDYFIVSKDETFFCRGIRMLSERWQKMINANDKYFD